MVFSRVNIAAKIPVQKQIVNVGGDPTTHRQGNEGVRERIDGSLWRYIIEEVITLGNLNLIQLQSSGKWGGIYAWKLSQGRAMIWAVSEREKSL